jgi:site-specific recombinase XerD
MARPTSKVTNVKVEGPLEPFVAAYRSRLQESGYTPLTIVNELRQVAHLSRWMEDAHLAASDLTPERLEQFLAPRRVAKGHGNCSLRGLLSLLEVLRGLGIGTEDPPGEPSSTNEVLLARFRTYLLNERGLAGCTAGAYVGRARRFLEECAADGELISLGASDVTRAVQREAARVSVGSAQFFVAGLRSFLRFGFIEGLVAVDLSQAALAVTGRRRSSLPRGISQDDAMALLAACDRRRSDGRRDYAVLVVLLRLGLRAGEVAGLTLDDIDWRAGEIVVRGKGRREDRLPVPVDVGEALAGYLQRGRPRTERRELFLRSLAPAGPLGRGGVSSIVRRACRRGGIAPVGAHRLRHTLACEMVAAGVPLPEIGQVLRHRAITSTAIYARVDLEALRGIALPWPGGDDQ